jgi:hypothetical protein
MAHTYPFMDWTKPDSVFHSYDTLRTNKIENNQFLIRFWIDPSYSVKQFVEIKETNNGYMAKKVMYGKVFNKKRKLKIVFKTISINPKSNWIDFIAKLDSIDFMSFKSRYHSWETDGGPDHTPMIWYRIEYFKKDLHNDFVFWKFAGDSMYGDMKKYEIITTLIDEEFYYKHK